jgi:hypothetical protein
MTSPTSVSERVARRVGVKEEKPRRSRKDPGLLHGPLAVSVEQVTPRMHKPCYQCGEPITSIRRLVVRSGAGRYAKTEVRCHTCGGNWLRAQHANYGRAIEYVLFGTIQTKRRPDLVDEGIRD